MDNNQENNINITKQGTTLADEYGTYREFWVLRGDNLTHEAVRDHLAAQGCQINGHYTQPGGSFSSPTAVWVNEAGTKALATQRNGFDI